MTLNWSKRGSSSYMGDYSSITEWLHELQEYGATQPSFDSKFLDSIEAWVKEFGGISPRQSEALANIDRMFEVRKQKYPDPKFPLRAERARREERERSFSSIDDCDIDYSMLPPDDPSIPF